MSKHSEDAPPEDVERYRALAQDLINQIPEKTSFHDIFQAALVIIRHVESVSNPHGPWRHFMAQELRKVALHCTRVGLTQMQPEDQGPSASGARCTELTDQFLDLTEGVAVAEVIGAGLNLIDIATGFITTEDRFKVAARMIHNAQAIAGNTDVTSVVTENRGPTH